MDSNYRKGIVKSTTNDINRIGYFDILRGIGVLLMIMGHVTFGKAFDIYIHAFHMPIFFFVSGYFYNHEKYNGTIPFVIHKMKTLLIPYTVFVLICQVLHYLYTGDFKISYFLLSYFSSNHNRIDVIGALWFLPCLFSAEIIFCLVNKIFINKYVKFLVVIIITLIGNCTPIDFPFCIDSAMSCMALMYLGYVLKKYSDNTGFKKLLNISNGWIIVLFILNVLLIMQNGSVNIRTNYYSNIMLYWLNCICAIVIYTNIAKKMDSSTNRVISFWNERLRYIGRNSLVYLLLNELMIFVMNTVFKICNIEVCMNLNVSFFMNQILVLTGCLVLLYLSTEIINRSFLKIFLGKF